MFLIKSHFRYKNINKQYNVIAEDDKLENIRGRHALTLNNFSNKGTLVDHCKSNDGSLSIRYDV
jgi:hypothetical protein